MNHRRALRIATDFGLAIFIVMILGVVLWTTDEMLNWNILPDWVDKYAQLLVTLLSILAGFAVVISVMCSFAVLAESAADKAGVASPPRSRRARVLLLGGAVIFFSALFGLHKLDQYRSAREKQAEQEKSAARFSQAKEELQRHTAEILALFSAERSALLTAVGNEQGDEALAQFLNAIHASAPSRAVVSVMVPATSPYKYCVLTALPESQYHGQDQTWRYMRREYLTGLPTRWERDTIEAMFAGRDLDIPRDRVGVFIDTRRPSAWGLVKEGATVLGILQFRIGAMP